MIVRKATIRRIPTIQILRFLQPLIHNAMYQHQLADLSRANFYYAADLHQATLSNFADFSGN